jgi:hypothetical protein
MADRIQPLSVEAEGKKPVRAANVKLKECLLTL